MELPARLPPSHTMFVFLDGCNRCTPTLCSADGPGRRTAFDRLGGVWVDAADRFGRACLPCPDRRSIDRPVLRLVSPGLIRTSPPPQPNPNHRPNPSKMAECITAERVVRNVILATAQDRANHPEYELGCAFLRYLRLENQGKETARIRRMLGTAAGEQLPTPETIFGT
jgi:hypothetical protein